MKFVEKPKLLPLVWAEERIQIKKKDAFFQDITQVFGDAAIIEKPYIVKSNTDFQQMRESFEAEGMAGCVIKEFPRKVLLELPQPMILWDHKGYRFSLMTWAIM